MHHADDAPFALAAHEGDWTMRAIPGEVSCADLKISHSHHNHSDADRDVNCMLPLTPLREFAAEGRIGSVAGQHYGLMGFVPDPAPLLDETVPELVAGLRDDGVDVVVLSPG